MTQRFHLERERAAFRTRPWLAPGRESQRCSFLKPRDSQRCKNMAGPSGLCQRHQLLAEERAQSDPALWSHVQLEHEVIRLRGLLLALGHENLAFVPAKRQGQEPTKPAKEEP